MCNIMVDVTLKKLLKVSEVFERLEPDRMADILQESISKAILGGAWTLQSLCLNHIPMLIALPEQVFCPFQW